MENRRWILFPRLSSGAVCITSSSSATTVPMKQTSVSSSRSIFETFSARLSSCPLRLSRRSRFSEKFLDRRSLLNGEAALGAVDNGHFATGELGEVDGNDFNDLGNIHESTLIKHGRGNVKGVGGLDLVR